MSVLLLLPPILHHSRCYCWSNRSSIWKGSLPYVFISSSVIYPSNAHWRETFQLQHFRVCGQWGVEAETTPGIAQTKVSPQKCECDFMSFRKYGVRRHGRRHTVEKPLRCQLFSFSSREKWHMMKHQRLKHRHPAASVDTPYHVEVHTRERPSFIFIPKTVRWDPLYTPYLTYLNWNLSISECALNSLHTSV